MHCPFCQNEDTRVIDSRVSEDGTTIRRRRECERCSERFNTFETVEIKLPAIVKSDGRREAFDERKLRTGVERSLQKRPVASDAVDSVVREIVRQLRAVNERELF
jgi:transcriptional repressor NrdR